MSPRRKLSHRNGRQVVFGSVVEQFRAATFPNAARNPLSPLFPQRSHLAFRVLKDVKKFKLTLQFSRKAFRRASRPGLMLEFSQKRLDAAG